MPHLERLYVVLLIQVFACPVWVANVPRLTIRALKGSCVVIPCAFSNPEPRKAPADLRIDWFRQQEASTVTIYSDQRTDQVDSAYQGRAAFVGDLERDDCSLQINNVSPTDAAMYYPWIEPLTKDYEEYTVQFSDQPEEHTLNNPGELTEGAPVRIRCSAVHTCPPNPPTLTWSWDRGNASIRHEDLGGGRWKVTSEIYYTPVTGDDNAPLECTVVYSNSVTSKKSITLQIRYPPKNTRAVVKGDTVLWEGDNVILVCSADGYPAVSHYSWSESQPERDLPGDGHEITLKNIRWDSGPYYCTATNEVGVGKSAPLRPTIMYPPKNTRAVVKGDTVLWEGDDVILVCSADGYPAVSHYSWSESQPERDLPGDGQEITLKNIRWDSGPYYCTATNKVGVGKSAPLRPTIMYTNNSSLFICAVLSFVGNVVLLLLLINTCVRCMKNKERPAGSQSSTEMVYVNQGAENSRKPKDYNESEYASLGNGRSEASTYETLHKKP